MKNKILLTIVCIFSFFMLTSCTNKDKENEQKIQNALNKISVPELLEDAIELPYVIDGYLIKWTFNKEDLLNPDGTLNKSIEEVEVIITASITADGLTLDKSFNTVIAKLTSEELVDKTFKEISVPSQASENIELPTKLNGLVISWTSNDKTHLTNKGIVKRDSIDVDVTLKATISYDGITKIKEYVVKVIADPVYVLIDEASNKLNIPTETYENISLPSVIDGISISWSSSMLCYN